MRQNFLMVEMVKNVEIPKGTDRQLFSWESFFSLQGILKQESQPRLCIKVTWGDLKKYGCPPPPPVLFN